MPDDLSTARRAEQSRARWTTYLLCACVALDATAIAFGLSQRTWLARLIAGAPLVPAEAAARDARHATLAMLQLVACLATAAVWLLWLRRAYTNLARVGSKRSSVSPGWAVGSWLIPFVNLTRPYQIMKELWLRSESLNDRDAFDNLPAPTFVPVWWALCLSWGVLRPVGAIVARDAHVPAELINLTDFGIVVDVVGIAAALFAIKVVRGIDRHQQRFQQPGGDAPRPRALTTSR